MQGFLDRHERNVVGVLSGFDRILFRGTLRSISYLDGMDKFLGAQHVLYKDFGRFAEGISQTLKEHAHQFAEQQNRPFEYLQSAAISKEDTARQIMQRDGIERGLVCVLSCVEPCQTYALRRDARNKHLVLVPALRKCLHLYFLLPGSRVRADARAFADVAADVDAGLPQRSRVSGSSHGPCGNRLS